PPVLAGRGRAVAVPVLPVAVGRRRLRRDRPPAGAPAAGHAGGLRPAGGRRAPAGPAGAGRHRAEPHLRRTPVVPRGAAGRTGVTAAAALHLPPRPGAWGATAAEQLGVPVRRPRLDPGAGRPVVPAPVRPAAAGPELAPPAGAGGVPRGAALLGTTGGGRVPHRLGRRPGQGSSPAGRGRGRRVRGAGRFRGQPRPPVPGPPGGARDLPGLEPGVRRVLAAADGGGRDVGGEGPAGRLPAGGRAAAGVQLRIPAGPLARRRIPPGDRGDGGDGLVGGRGTHLDAGQPRRDAAGVLARAAARGEPHGVVG